MAAELTIGDDGIAVAFLFCDDVANRLVLRLAQFFFVDLTAVEAGNISLSSAGRTRLPM